MCSVPGIGDIGNLLNLCHGGGFTGDLNNICQPSLPQPEPATGGIDAIIRPPATPGPQGKTLYDNYGVAGQFWAATDMQCSDMTSLIGNNVAGMVFDAAKAVDRVTITVYQSAAGNGILAWLSGVVDRLISSLGNAVYFPYLAPVVLLGVMWLAWHGLIRKRATRTIEGTIWMVVACAAAIWLIGRPADFTGVGQAVSNGVTQVLNVAFSKLPNPGGGNCVPVHSGDPQSPGGANFGFTQGNGLVDQNANELWSVLVCKPWLDGEFGTTQFSTGRTGQTPVNAYGRQLLWSQAIAANEAPTAALIKAKQTVYSGIAASIKAHDPAIYPLFQGKQWTSRLEIGFAGLFAALVAGVLVLLIAITLIILKLGFLLLLIAGPFFLIVGTHPGFGRVVATRWFEMLVGVLLKSVAVAIVLSVLLYAYSLIMGTSDSVLPWALKILMIALVTIAVFIYRKPFQHLFSAVGYGSIGARERAELEIYRSREVLRRNATGVAAVAVGGFAGYGVGRLARRGATHSTALAEHIALAAGSGGPDAGAAGNGPMPNGSALADANAPPEGAEPGDGQAGDPGVRAGARGQGRTWAAADVDGAPSAAPPLHLPSRAAGGADDAQPDAAGWARRGVESAGVTRPLARTGEAPPRPAAPRTAPPAAGQARAASGAGEPAGQDGDGQRLAAAGRQRAWSGAPAAGHGRPGSPARQRGGPGAMGRPRARPGAGNRQRSRPAGQGGDGRRAGAIRRQRARPGAGDRQLRRPAGRAGMAGGPVRSGGGRRAGAIRQRPRRRRRAGARAAGRCDRAGAGRCEGGSGPVRGGSAGGPPRSAGPGPRPAPASARRSAARPVGLGDRAGLGRRAAGWPATLAARPHPTVGRLAGRRRRAIHSGVLVSVRVPAGTGASVRSGASVGSGASVSSGVSVRSGASVRSGVSAGSGVRGLVSRGSAGVAAPPAVSGRPARVSRYRARFRRRTCRAAAAFTRRRCLAGTCCARSLPPRRRGGERRARERYGGERRGAGTVRRGTARAGTARRGTARRGTAASPGAVPGGQDEAARREAPLPFWLRPVRRKK